MNLTDVNDIGELNQIVVSLKFQDNVKKYFLLGI